MNHFNPILNKYNTVKKKLKAKVTERKELNEYKAYAESRFAFITLVKHE